MWYLEKKITISGAHFLRNYNGECANIHGHNFAIIVYCKGSILDEKGMVIELSEVKKTVMKYDHKMLNDFDEFGPKGLNPTMENLAEYLCHTIPHCYKIEIDETPNNKIIYEKDD